jgi:hypothetical protein
MIVTNQAQLARMQTLADGTVRLTIDFNESVTPDNVTDLIKGILKVIIVADKPSTPTVLADAVDKIIDTFGSES